ncbi:LLM class flavin-dependent oxidoreductase [Mycolicibacterium wolinskyi]|uniref:LLM class flavin-dependent oxidoreductase n=1 Tax=Mycolicibacterium wolinskyi TaxID=59750 RepID=UPI0039176D98
MISLGPIGLASSNPFTDDAAVVADEARHAEALGFATLWRSGNLPMLAAAVRATSSIPVATGIIPVVRVSAADVIATHAELERRHPGRFVVGIGGAHGPQPMATLNAYLDELDAAGIDSRVLAALGPNMLALARDRASGAYPYLVTPSYVSAARAALGPDGLLAVLLMVIPVTDRDAARDRLLDGIAAWGSPERIAERIADYHGAGADQVVLRILGVDDMGTWRARLARTLFGSA